MSSQDIRPLSNPSTPSQWDLSRFQRFCEELTELGDEVSLNFTFNDSPTLQKEAFNEKVRQRGLASHNIYPDNSEHTIAKIVATDEGQIEVEQVVAFVTGEQPIQGYSWVVMDKEGRLWEECDDSTVILRGNSLLEAGDVVGQHISPKVHQG